jgi:hypothetical protein
MRKRAKQRLEKNRYLPGTRVWVGYNENSAGTVVADDGWSVEVKLDSDGATVSCHADQVFQSREAELSARIEDRWRQEGILGGRLEDAPACHVCGSCEHAAERCPNRLGGPNYDPASTPDGV